MKAAADFYNREFAGEAYAGAAPERPEAAELRAFVAEFGLEGKPVLEVGCGRGGLQDVTTRWVGVDLAFAAGRHIDKPFAVGSAEALPFRSGSFAGVWSITVLEHVPRPERALEEIARVLAPGGVAHLAPAWHCRPWAAEGYQVRPWSDFGLRGKLVKASIPLRDALPVRAARELPARAARELYHQLRPRTPLRFRFRPLRANYDVFWTSDSDACCSMDPHEMLLWFRSRGWTSPSHPTAARRLAVRHGAVVVRKPEGAR